jgi:CRP-like cAMP-binding protein
MDKRLLGKVYKDAEIIIKQGQPGDCMYVVQAGLVEVVKETGQGEVQLAIRGPGEFVGEMAIFEARERMATVRALGEAQVLTIDKRNLLRRMHEDPTLAFRLVQVMSSRIRSLSATISEGTSGK